MTDHLTAEPLSELDLAYQAGVSDGVAGIPDPNSEVLGDELREAYLHGFTDGQAEVNPASAFETVD